ncbi:MAG: sulfite exporter TauE/SafE family protein [Pseudomonadota bacterium]|nr:sulfite exporter TauE/SafE family protein [Pseudomonadota bacterium]
MSGLIILTGVFVTAFISGVFGMAGGLILMGILALVLPVSAAMVVHGVVQSVSNGWRAILHARWIDWRILGIYLFGSGASAALLVLATFELSKPWLFIVLGLVPGVIWLPRRWVHFDAARPAHAVACGFTVTGLNVVAGVSGPLLDVFFADTERDRRCIVATKAATQVVSHAVKIAYYVLPALAAESLPQAQWLLIAAPLAIVGTTLGARFLAMMSDVQFRQWTKWIVSAIGLVYIARGLIILTGVAP